MRGISKKVREENSNNKFFKTCCVPDCPETDITWQHSLKYKGRQLADIVVPLCRKHHLGNGLGSITREGSLWSELWSITLHREWLTKNCPKFDWIQRKNYLENILKKTL